MYVGYGYGALLQKVLKVINSDRFDRLRICDRYSRWQEQLSDRVKRGSTLNNPEEKQGVLVSAL